ncbi:MAG: hypothetical protein F2534_11645 [Actinobacteria bacterium]|nr:hypothetical protein [Actinomycetota bacterium]
MDLADRLERELWRCARGGIPEEWQGSQRLAACSSAEELVARVRRIGVESDVLVDDLLAVSDLPEVATLVLAVAAAPLARARCGRDRDRCDLLLTEFALAVSEARVDRPMSVRHRLSLLLDRSWDRVRRARPHGFAPVDPDELDRTGVVADPFAGVLDRDVLDSVRARLERDADAGIALVRAWNSALELYDREGRSEAERDRWKYVRRLLRRLDVDDSAA